jgi:formylglycine-generating enzyme required for sulfatase activity
VAGATPTPDLEYFLSRSQWFDVGSTLDDAECARLAPRLRDLLSRTVEGSGEEHRRWWIWAAVAAGALVLAAGGWWIRQVTTTSMTSGPGAPPATPAAPVASVGVKTNPLDGQPYVWIPPGQFVMGCSVGDPACDMDEQPTHNVTIPRGFWLGRTEVTRRAYQASRGGGGTEPADGDANLPVADVSWADANTYCAAVGGRLPTEAEWEYAARAGTTTRYYDTPADSAWFGDNADGAPHPVATRRANAFQLYDMLGNVSEWVRDRYYNRYDDSGDPAAVEEPLAPNASATARGGSWVSDAEGVRASRRLQMEPDAKEPHIGFRCVVESL